jgi:hypothetical protein
VKDIKKTAINLILCSSIAAFPLAAFPTDSTLLKAIPLTTPSYTTGTTVYGACFNNAAGGVLVSDPLGTQGTPYHLQLGNAVNITYLATTAPVASNSVPFSGHYYVKLNLIMKQMTSSPVYFWVDDYAASQDISGNATSLRVFYSGDVPYALNSGNNTTSTILLTGIVYLRQGSTIVSPRVWAIPDAATGNPAQLCIEGTGYDADGDSTFSATLLAFP